MTTEQYNKLMDMQRIKAKDGEEDEVVQCTAMLCVG